MKTIFCIALFSFFLLQWNFISAQDVDNIIKKDGSTVQGKVLKVTENDIEYDPVGDIPFIKVPRAEIVSVIYSDGTKVDFNEPETPAKKEQSTQEARLVIEQKDFLSKLFGGVKSNEILTADVINYTNEISSSDPAHLVVTLNFLDNNNKNREAKLEMDYTKGMFQKLTVSYYLDGNLIFTQKQFQTEHWIDTSIPNDRILITIKDFTARSNANGTRIKYRLIGMLERLDKIEDNTKDLELIKEKLLNSPSRPLVLIEKKTDKLFDRQEAYYLGKDKNIHLLRIETDCNPNIFPRINICRLIIDHKIVKEISQNFGQKNKDIIQFDYTTKDGDKIDVTVDLNFNAGRKEYKVILSE